MRTNHPGFYGRKHANPLQSTHLLMAASHPGNPQYRQNSIDSVQDTLEKSKPFRSISPPNSDSQNKQILTPLLFSGTINLTQSSILGFIPDTSIQNFLGVKPDLSDDMFETSTYTQILEYPKALEDLWVKLQMPLTEKPEIDWNRELVVFIARNNSTHPKDSLPHRIQFFETLNQLLIELLPERKAPGKNKGLSWYVGVFPKKPYSGEKFLEHISLRSFPLSEKTEVLCFFTQKSP